MRWEMCRTGDFTEQEYRAVYEKLSPSRKKHMDAFSNEAARRCSLAGELLLRRLLAAEGIAAVPERLPSGQPVLPGGQAFVSISHCDDRVVCAVSRAAVGIDIEKVRPIRPGMMDRVCTAEELRYLRSGNETERFFEVWTAKEAYFKMKGTGITNLQAINILTLPRQVFRQEDYLIQIVYEQS